MLLKTFNEKTYPALFAAAIARGTDVGATVASQGWVKADQIIGVNANMFVMGLSLDDASRLSRELRWAFIGAAEKEATKPV